ncbi:MAG: nucleotidyltransferase family protein [Ignavibacteriae bacterium]|nr:MAG: nucleotidyltransferase family protein [Ignavibacteriota bacterium]
MNRRADLIFSDHACLAVYFFMPHSPHIALLVLAAGASTRLGIPKQRIPYRGKPLLRSICEIALQSKAQTVVVVLGSQAALIKEDIEDLKMTLVENSLWKEGLSTSIRAGILSLPESADAVLMIPCDQPEITPALLDQIIGTYIATGNKIIACRYGDTVGIPALYDRSIFPELLALQGDQGAKPILHRYADIVRTVDFPLGVYDIDTPQDLAGQS